MATLIVQATAQALRPPTPTLGVPRRCGRSGEKHHALHWHEPRRRDLRTATKFGRATAPLLLIAALETASSSDAGEGGSGAAVGSCNGTSQRREPAIIATLGMYRGWTDETCGETGQMVFKTEL